MARRNHLATLPVTMLQKSSEDTQPSLSESALLKILSTSSSPMSSPKSLAVSENCIVLILPAPLGSKALKMRSVCGLVKSSLRRAVAMRMNSPKSISPPSLFSRFCRRIRANLLWWWNPRLRKASLMSATSALPVPLLSNMSKAVLNSSTSSLVRPFLTQSLMLKGLTYLTGGTGTFLPLLG